MRARANLWSILGTIVLLWLCGGSLLFMTSAGNVSLTPAATSQYLSATEAQAARSVGAAIGGGLGVTFFVCTGVPLVTLFALLAWRNRVGLITENRHQNQIAPQISQFQTIAQSHQPQ